MRVRVTKRGSSTLGCDYNESHGVVGIKKPEILGEGPVSKR